MLLHFYKMTGAGNDFVMVDNRVLSLSSVLDKETIEALCDRRFGIGADGLIAVEPSQGKGGIVRMRYYNADGGEAEMCGNGARCFGNFAAALLHHDKTAPLPFETMAGVVTATFEKDDNVTVNLTNPHSMQLFVLNADPTVGADVHFLNTGVPHAVAFLDKLEGLDISKLGAYLRYHEAFSPKGTNANFARILSPGHIAIRTYERGVEDETLACGTGITACALLHAVLTDAPSPIQVDVAGGDTLKVGFQRTGDRFTDVTLTGPADLVFTGDIQI